MQVIDHPDSCRCGYFKLTPPKAITVLEIEKITPALEDGTLLGPRPGHLSAPAQAVTAKVIEFKFAVIFKIDCPNCDKSLFLQHS